MSKLHKSSPKEPKKPKDSWNHLRYWFSTIGLVAMIGYEGVKTLVSSAAMESASLMSKDLKVPEYLGLYVVPIGSLIAAVIILIRKRPLLRVFAYAWVLFYFVIELILVAHLGNKGLIAFSINKLLTWTGAFYWDRDRIAKSLPQETKIA
jgi:hypothetical protein